MGARKDLIDSGAIKDYKDFKDRKIAITSKGSSNEILLDVLVQRGGFTLKDVETVILPMPDMIPAFANKGIDAAIIQEPNITVGIGQGVVVRWKGVDELRPYGQVGAFVYSRCVYQG